MKLTEKQMQEMLAEPLEQLNENNFYLKVFTESTESLSRTVEEEFIF